MTAYEAMISLNRRMITGQSIPESEREEAASFFLSERSDRKTVARFYDSVHAPRLEDGDGRRMYPESFIPPYIGGKKYLTVTGVTPATQLLSSNAYELEILRLLALFAPNNPECGAMINRANERLDGCCFANDCADGECYEAGTVALRYYAAVGRDAFRVKRLLDKQLSHLRDKRRHSGTSFYLWLTLAELPSELALPAIETFKEELYRHLNRSAVMNSDFDTTYNPQCLYIARNALSMLPQFAYIRGRKPYIDESDGRLHFNLSE